MTANLPTVTEPIAGSLTTSVNWRRWFQRVQKALQDGTLSAEGLEADIAAIATALGSPDGTVENIPPQAEAAVIIAGDGIAVSGSLAAGAVTISSTVTASPPSFVPTLVADGDTFTVTENSQALFALPIELEGDAVLVLDGALVEVG